MGSTTAGRKCYNSFTVTVYRHEGVHLAPGGVPDILLMYKIELKNVGEPTLHGLERNELLNAKTNRLSVVKRRRDRENKSN